MGNSPDFAEPSLGTPSAVQQRKKFSANRQDQQREPGDIITADKGGHRSADARG
jgi:hypothetical protein